MVRKNTKLIVVFHFDSNFGLNYKDTPDRRKRTINKKEWWQQRERIFTKFVLPSLAGQSFKGFDVWGLFMRGYEKLAGPMVRVFKKNGFHVSFDGPHPIRAHYFGKQEWLGLVHHDSDDLYSLDAFQLMTTQKPAAGRVVYLHTGYMYCCEPKDGRLFEITKPDQPPLSFHMMYYPNWALASEPHWYGYRRVFGIAVDHFQLAGVKDRVVVVPGHYCQIIHGTNTVSTMENPRMLKRIIKQIKNPKQKRSILRRFGVIV